MLQNSCWFKVVALSADMVKTRAGSGSKTNGMNGSGSRANGQLNSKQSCVKNESNGNAVPDKVTIYFYSVI